MITSCKITAVKNMLIRTGLECYVYLNVKLI